MRGRSFHAFTLAIENGGELLQAGEVGFRVLTRCNGMVGAQKARYIEVGANVLDHHVRRVAPTSDRNVAIGQGEAFHSGAVCALDDFQAGKGLGVQSSLVQSPHLSKVTADGLGEAGDARGGCVSQAIAKIGMLASIDA